LGEGVDRPLLPKQKTICFQAFDLKRLRIIEWNEIKYKKFRIYRISAENGIRLLDKPLDRTQFVVISH